MLLAEVLERDLDALVVHLLEVALELVAALGAAMEELRDVADRRTLLPAYGFDLGRRSDIDQAVRSKSTM
ncbi:MAG TPA: hypothetical protein VFR73_23195 [Hyphomicrobiaceae bacterium]|nr:hypothetical protein [Hyphomicrobiaceae bacterium]